MLNKEEILAIGNSWLSYEVDHAWNNPNQLKVYLEEIERDYSRLHLNEISQAISIVKERLKEFENMEQKEFSILQYEIHLVKYTVKARTEDEAIMLHMNYKSEKSDIPSELVEYTEHEGERFRQVFES
jgi:hypothetical protein